MLAITLAAGRAGAHVAPSLDENNRYLKVSPAAIGSGWRTPCSSARSPAPRPAHPWMPTATARSAMPRARRLAPSSARRSGPASTSPSTARFDQSDGTLSRSGSAPRRSPAGRSRSTWSRGSACPARAAATHFSFEIGSTSRGPARPRSRSRTAPGSRSTTRGSAPRGERRHEQLPVRRRGRTDRRGRTGRRVHRKRESTTRHGRSAPGPRLQTRGLPGAGSSSRGRGRVRARRGDRVRAAPARQR